MFLNFLKPNYVFVSWINFPSEYIIASLRNMSIKRSPEIKKSVFVSQSHDIFTNLALEDWIYKNMNFSNHHVLMLWQNDPCVVIGRHQNPWLEANIFGLAEQKVQLARRNSGGGTVYHDLGNLNLTFFTSRECYNRTQNLEMISRALFRDYGLKSTISPKEDLTIRDYKISGTAAKIGRPNSYHHCTLLVNVNKLNLMQALGKRQIDIVTNATKSTPTSIMNLCEEIPTITIDSLIETFGWEYLNTNSTTIGEENKFEVVDPNDQFFPGLSEIRSYLASWEWCYGKTPDFQIDRCFQDLKIGIFVKKGHIVDIVLNSSPGLQEDIKFIMSFKGSKFTEEIIASLESFLATNNFVVAGADKGTFISNLEPGFGGKIKIQS